MVRSLCCILASVAILAACAPRTTRDAAASGLAGSAEDRAALVRLQEEWGQALVRRDTTFFARVLAEDFESGATTKARLIAGVRDTMAVLVERSGVEDVRVRFFGPTAVVTAVSTSEGRRGGQPFAERSRYMRVFVRRDGRWQAVAGLAAPAPR